MDIIDKCNLRFLNFHFLLLKKSKIVKSEMITLLVKYKKFKALFRNVQLDKKDDTYLTIG